MNEITAACRRSPVFTFCWDIVGNPFETHRVLCLLMEQDRSGFPQAAGAWVDDVWDPTVGPANGSDGREFSSWFAADDGIIHEPLAWMSDAEADRKRARIELVRAVYDWMLKLGLDDDQSLVVPVVMFIVHQIVIGVWKIDQITKIDEITPARVHALVRRAQP